MISRVPKELSSVRSGASAESSLLSVTGSSRPRACHSSPEHLHEDVDAFDATEITGSVVTEPLMGPSVVVVVDVACPYERQRLEAADVQASAVADVEPGVRIHEGRREVHRDAAERGHDVGEGLEVQHHVVVDRDAEVLLDRGRELIRAIGKRRVDLVVKAARASVRHEGVARNRQQHRSLVRHQPEDHDDVAVDPVDVVLALLHEVLEVFCRLDRTS